MLELLCIILAVFLAKLFLFTLLRKNLISYFTFNLVSLYFCLSCMKTNFFVSFIRFSMNIVARFLKLTQLLH